MRCYGRCGIIDKVLLFLFFLKKIQFLKNSKAGQTNETFSSKVALLFTIMSRSIIQYWMVQRLINLVPNFQEDRKIPKGRQIDGYIDGYQLIQRAISRSVLWYSFNIANIIIGSFPCYAYRTLKPPSPPLFQRKNNIGQVK